MSAQSTGPAGCGCSQQVMLRRGPWTICWTWWLRLLPWLLAGGALTCQQPLLLDLMKPTPNTNMTRPSTSSSPLRLPTYLPTY
eukprot:644590-Heterocapsa_arctica.AAC.1